MSDIRPFPVQGQAALVFKAAMLADEFLVQFGAQGRIVAKVNTALFQYMVNTEHMSHDFDDVYRMRPVYLCLTEVVVEEAPDLSAGVFLIQLETQEGKPHA